VKVLHIDSELTWRGGQNQTRLLIEGLLDEGITVHLVTPRGSALSHLMSGKLPIYEVIFRRGLSYQAAGKEVAKYCRDHGIDLIDAQSSKAHSLALAAKKYFKDIKIVVHRRVDYIPKLNPFTWLKYKNKSINQYVAISEAIGVILRRYGIKPDKISVVHSAASPLDFNFQNKSEAKKKLAAELSLDSSQVWLGNVSALTDQKDYPTLIKSLALVKQQYGDHFHCLIAGSGKLERHIRKLIKNSNLSEQVTMLGFREDVPDILQSLDILAIPSKFEGLGTIILDALQAECCVIATKAGGIPEMIFHGKTGLLSPVGNENEFSKNLMKAINSKSTRNLLATTGKALIEKSFTVENMVSGNIAIYKKTLGLI